MFNRANRYRYVNLATQQIRLRNILRLSAHNLNLRSEAHLYFTIHRIDSSAEEQAIYTSSRVSSRKHNKRTFDWPEISYQTVNQGILKAVCIKLWDDSCSGEPLFSWSVQLKELVAFDSEGKDGSIDLAVPSEKFNENSLEFVTNAGAFVIPSSLCVEALREQLTAGYRGECKVSRLRFEFHRFPSNVIRFAVWCDSDSKDDEWSGRCVQEL